MTWLRVDDQFHGHPKVAAVSDAAAGLWIKAATWSAAYRTDGFVPGIVLESLAKSRRRNRLVAELVSQNLWEPAPGGDGFVFHDWADYQPLRADDEDRKRRNAERMRAYRQGLSESVEPDGYIARDAHVAGHVTGDVAAHVQGTAGDVAPHVQRSERPRSSAPSRARAHAPAPPPSSSSLSSSVTGSSARATATDDDDRFEPREQDPERVNGFVPAGAQRAAVVMAQVRELTGLTIGPAAAEAIRDDILDGRSPRDAAGYLRTSIAAEHRRDPALTRWLTPARRGRPSPRAAPDVLADAAEGRHASDPATAHRGADAARQGLAARAAEAAAKAEPAAEPPALPEPAELRAAQLAAEPGDPGDEAAEEPPEPLDEPDASGQPDDGDDAADMEVPF